MNQYAITITKLGDESAAGELYRRVVERDDISPIVTELDKALNKRRRNRRSDAKQPELIK